MAFEDVMQLQSLGIYILRLLSQDMNTAIEEVRRMVDEKKIKYGDFYTAMKRWYSEVESGPTLIPNRY